MERSAKEANKEQKPNGRGSSQTALIVDSVRGAKEALKTLVNAGCRPESIIRDLHFYRGGNAAETKSGLKSARQFAGTIKKVTRRLINVADEVDEIQKFNRICMQSGVGAEVVGRDVGHSICKRNVGAGRGVEPPRPEGRRNLSQKIGNCKLRVSNAFYDLSVYPSRVQCSFTKSCNELSVTV